MGEVPVLVDGETVLTQSGVILDYISSKTGKLGGRSAAERRDVLRWLFWDNHKLSTQIGTVRFLANFLPEDKRPAGVIPFLQGRLKAAYTVPERASRGSELDRRRPAHHRGPLLLLLSLLPRALRLHPQRLARHRRLAGPHRGAAGLEAPLRLDARQPFRPGLRRRP